MYFLEVANNNDLLEDLLLVDKRANQEIRSSSIIHTVNGKEAINKSLGALDLELSDEVFITSTFGAKYVSKCVTCSVFNHCQPSKILTENTKIIFVIHEFGVPHPQLDELYKKSRELGLILIEDCAHSSNSYDENNRRVGTLGDVVIYSHRKVLPMSVGGGLKINNQEVFSNAKFESNSAVEEEFNRLDIHAEYFSELRQRNYNLLDELIFAPAHFTLSSTCSPYVFSIEIKNPKSFQSRFEQEFGRQFESATWFGLSIVSFPVHQMMSEDSVKELSEKINYTLKAY